MRNSELFCKQIMTYSSSGSALTLEIYIGGPYMNTEYKVEYPETRSWVRRNIFIVLWMGVVVAGPLMIAANILDSKTPSAIIRFELTALIAFYVWQFFSNKMDLAIKWRLAWMAASILIAHFLLHITENLPFRDHPMLGAAIAFGMLCYAAFLLDSSGVADDEAIYEYYTALAEDDHRARSYKDADECLDSHKRSDNPAGEAAS